MGALIASQRRAIVPQLRRVVFGISRREALFERRGFSTTSAASRTRLESIGAIFIDGYNAWLSDDLDAALHVISPDLQGFAVEGAAMASALVDHVTPWPWRRGRWAKLLRARPEHAYMIHVGAGWATARLRGSLRRAVACRDPLLGWLVADGWGFHQAYFHPRQWATGVRRLPVRWGYVARAVDQGIGRALWFVGGADPSRVADAIEQFAAERRPDLWSGVGLAATYAGGCPPGELADLVTLAGVQRGPLAQGAAFAAAARARAGNPTAHTDVAATVIAGQSAGDLARLASALEPAAPHHALGASYELWRTRITGALAGQEAA